MPRALPRSRRRPLRAFVLFRLALPLGQSILQRELQLLDRGMRKNHTIIFQQVIRMNLIAGDQLEPCNITRAQFQVAIRGVGGFHDQYRFFNFQRIERGAELLGLCVLHIERVHDGELTVGKLRCQC